MSVVRLRNLSTDTALAKAIGVTAAGAAAGRDNDDAMADLLATAGVPAAIGDAATVNVRGRARSLQSQFRDYHFNAMDYVTTANDSTDNKVPLQAMADDINAMPAGRTYNILFPPGDYRYSSNAWTNSIRDRGVRMYGYGASLMCTNVNPNWFIEWACINFVHLYRETSASSPTQAPSNVDPKFYHYSVPYYYIDTQDPSSLTVTTSTAADAGNFVAGDRVFISGWSTQRDSYPPNQAVFEWNEVVSAVAGTGVITLKWPLKYAYNEDWLNYSHDPFDTSVLLGAPHIIKDRSLPLIEMHGFYIRRNVALGGGYTQFEFLNGRNTRIVDIKSDDGIQFATAMSELCEIERCNVEAVESDKLIDTLSFNNSTVRKELIQGTGTNNIKIDGGSYNGVGVVPTKSMSVKNASILKPSTFIYASVQEASISSATLDLENVNFSGAPTSTHLQGWLRSAWASFTVGSYSAGIVSITANNAGVDSVARLAVGALVHTAEGTKWGRILAIYLDSGNIQILGRWSSAPTAADVFRYGCDGAVTSKNIHGVPNGHDVAYVRVNGSRSQRYTIPGKALDVTSAGQYIAQLLGMMRNIEVNVTKPYTGDVSGFLYLYQYYNGVNTNFLIVDLLTAGIRRLDTIVGNTTPLGGDNFALGGIVPLALQLTGAFYRNGFVVGLIGSASEMPEFTLTFEANTPV